LIFGRGADAQNEADQKREASVFIWEVINFIIINPKGGDLLNENCRVTVGGKGKGLREEPRNSRSKYQKYYI